VNRLRNSLFIAICIMFQPPLHRCHISVFVGLFGGMQTNLDAWQQIPIQTSVGADWFYLRRAMTRE
jgi:hypothetical protein